MHATDVLMNEHRVIERVLDALEKGIERIEAGNPPEPRFFLDAAEFMRGFADGCHHHKEEDMLFKEMVAAGMPTHQGPIAVMLTEHDQGRRYTKAIREAAEVWQEGDESASQQVVTAARGYIGLLRAHIQKEDNILFPMAEQVITGDRQSVFEKEFVAAEEEEAQVGTCVNFVVLAEQLEREVK